MESPSTRIALLGRLEDSHMFEILLTHLITYVYLTGCYHTDLLSGVLLILIEWTLGEFVILDLHAPQILVYKGAIQTLLHQPHLINLMQMWYLRMNPPIQRRHHHSHLYRQWHRFLTQ